MAANTVNQKLTIKFHGRILEHLGIQMYQSPTSAISEMIANSWDADSEIVEITLPQSLTQKSVITVQDDGAGMTFQECQDFFLLVGRNRVKALSNEKSPKKERPLLGRKGIGKFAGFGIAEIIEVETISKESGERTIFTLNINELMAEDEYISTEGKEIELILFEAPDDQRKNNHGTKITLKSLKLGRSIPVEQFMNGLARRFLLSQIYDDFKIKVNNQEIPESFSDTLEFCFPKEYKEEEKPEKLLEVDEDGWGLEEMDNGQALFWRIGFYEETIKEEELRGITIFTKGKLSQRPFLFNLTGGLSGQHAIEYMTGQVQLDYVAHGDLDLIATERQRINWEDPNAKIVEIWGQTRIKSLLKIWQKRRTEKREKHIKEKLAEYDGRLSKFMPHERKTVEKALTKLAGISAISVNQLNELSGSVITAWETGRLRELIHSISEADDINSDMFIGLLLESDVLTALNMAEAIKTKISAIIELKKLIQGRELENKLRDYLYEKPWIISPEWEKFEKEKSIENIVKKAGETNFNPENLYSGRVDLVLSSGTQLLIIEFMRPGLEIDRDHINRFNDYVLDIKTALKANSGLRFNSVNGYLIADNTKISPANIEKIDELERKGLYALSWDLLLRRSIKQWEIYLDILKRRNPTDDRIKNL
ncbi:MAG: ATP-binding protein [Candidatus Margulisbacteria bacterium]|nr:ATP-binding protein [Candidatus Margulisiibacteriota bacterium]